MMNELLNNDLAKYYNLLNLEEAAQQFGMTLEEVNEYVKSCEQYCDVKMLGILSIKDGYEDRSWEVDGSLYGEDNQIYYAYGDFSTGNFRVVDIDIDYALDNIKKIHA